MANANIKDNVPAGATVETLQERVKQLSDGLQSAIGYMDKIAKKKWIPRPDAIIDELKAILGVKGKDDG